ncbi:MAG TPA: kelch repeat-containing protein [Candidatus Dormibacteraeota bacterium]
MTALPTGGRVGAGLDVCVESRQCDPWTRRFLGPEMTCCELRGDDADIGRLLGALVDRDQAPGHPWVAHVAGPSDEIAAEVGVAVGAFATAATAVAMRSPAGPPMHVTFALRPDDPAVRVLVEGRAVRHRTLALLRVAEAHVVNTLQALEEGRDADAVGHADLLIVHRPGVSRSTIAVRSPPPFPPGFAGPTVEVPGRVVATAADLSGAERHEAAEGRTMTARTAALVIGATAAVTVAASLLLGAARLTPGSVESLDTRGAAAAVTTAPPSPVGAALAAEPLRPERAGRLPTTAPAAPSFHDAAAVAVDAGRGDIVLFGGRAAGGAAAGDTWTFDGVRWTARDVTPAPSPRWGAAAAWDPISGRVVLFGGISASGWALDDTWLWDGASWRAITTPTQPPRGVAAGAAYSSALGEVVLVSAPQSDGATQTWAWSGGAWARRATQDHPVVRGPAVLADDPVQHLQVLVDAGTNTTWTFDGARWSRRPAGALSLDPRAAARMVYDQLSHGLILVQSSRSATAGVTWTYDGASWKRRLTPAALQLVGALATDRTARPIALTGAEPSALLSDLWRWQDAHWQR